MATIEAVERRRMSRRYKFRSNSYRSQARDEKKRSQRSLEDAFRIAERAIEVERARYAFRRVLRGKEIPENDIRDLPEYWLLRHFGYDVRAKEHTQITRPGGAIAFLAPEKTEIWKWWIGFDLSTLVKEMRNGKAVRVCALRKLVAEQHPNNIVTTVADADAARRKYVKLISEENRVNPL